MKIIFMGTPDFAREALQAICERTDHEVICVYSQPPRPKGRGHKVQPSPVHEYAQAQGIEVRTPLNLKSAEDREAFAALDADVAIVAAYGLLLPKVILDAPKYGCINIHASLLPRWRGASPIQQSIWKGDSETGVTLMQMDVGLDTGDMLMKRSVAINADTTTLSLHDALATLGGEMVVDLLQDIGAITPKPQDDALTTYAPLLKKEDGAMDWTQSAAAIDRQIRALTPWPSVKSESFKFIEARPAAQKTDRAAGTLLDKTGHVACGDGSVLQIIKIQPTGKKPMDIASAINGGYIKIGEVIA